MSSPHRNIWAASSPWLIFECRCRLSSHSLNNSDIHTDVEFHFIGNHRFIILAPTQLHVGYRDWLYTVRTTRQNQLHHNFSTSESYLNTDTHFSYREKRSELTVWFDFHIKDYKLCQEQYSKGLHCFCIALHPRRSIVEVVDATPIQTQETIGGRLLGE